MLKSILILPDGTEIASGAGAVNALQSVKLTQRVNAGEELTLGSACANMLEATIITPQGGLNIASGTEVTLYKEDDEGNRTKVGLFTMEKPSRPSANTYKVIAYDRMSWLDRDLTQWLAGLKQWPYPLLTFARMVCEACGLRLITTEIPNGDFPVREFAAGAITGRKLVQWAGEACGRFCRVTPDGDVEFAWYTPKNITIDTGGDNYALFDSVRYADYQVAPIEKVQIRWTEADVGAIYGSGDNAYIITGNCLLNADSQASLQAAAQEIYNGLQGVSYTPCKVRVVANTQIQAGDVVELKDRNGKTFPIYVMTKIQSGQTDTLECTGSANRNTTTIANNSQIISLNRRVLEIHAGIEGLKFTNKEMEGRLTAAETEISQNTNEIQLTANSTNGQIQNIRENLATTDERIGDLTVRQNEISASVEHTTTRLDETNDTVTALERRVEASMTEDGVNLLISKSKEEGAQKVVTSTGYTFDETGFTVEKSGREMKTQITEDGMTVYKNGVTVLKANNTGVDAVNLHASTYLVVGNRSRFENYGTNRTGCFWIGG